MNILVIAPHPDDEVIGCGGTLCKHASKGDRITAAFLTSGELGLKQYSGEKAWEIREAEAHRAAKIIGIDQLEFLRLPDWHLDQHIREGAGVLRKLLRQIAPNRIFLPHPLDSHPDHRVVLPMLRAALRGSSRAQPELLGYEVWTPITDFAFVEDISMEMPRKCRALRCHQSQLTGFGYERATRGLNQFRGELTDRCRYAEVFQALSLRPRK